MAVRFLKIAVVYLFIGAVLGLFMGITQKFQFAPVHAHILLAGWATFALAGVIYHLHPQAAATMLAKVHFWLHNVGLPIFMFGLTFVVTGDQGMIPVVAAGATTLLVGLALFVLNVLVNVKASGANG